MQNRIGSHTRTSFDYLGVCLCVCTRVTGRRQCHILTLFYPRTMLFCVRAMTLTPISTSKIGLIQEIQSVQQYYSSITFKGEQTRTLLF